VKQGNPKELAARSREEYLKVCHLKFISFPPGIFFGELHAVKFVCSKLMLNSSMNYAQMIYRYFTDNMVVFQLKQQLQLLTLGIGGIGVVSAYSSYTPEIAARYKFVSFSCLPSSELVVEQHMLSSKHLFCGYLRGKYGVCLLGYHFVELFQLISVTFQLLCRTDWITDISPHAWN
jgi:hypothetical protein